VFLSQCECVELDLHIGHVPAWHVGPMVLGNIGYWVELRRTWRRLVLIPLLTLLNTMGVKIGSAVQNVFYFCQSAGAGGGGCWWV